MLIGFSLFCSKSLILKSDLEWFSHADLYKRATVSDLFRLLMTKERQWAIRSGHSWKKSNGSYFLFHKRITLLLTKNKGLAQKIDEQIPNPASISLWKRSCQLTCLVLESSTSHFSVLSAMTVYDFHCSRVQYQPFPCDRVHGSWLALFWSPVPAISLW